MTSNAFAVLPGAQGALRGYRLQHLYTLHRLLHSSGLSIHLEGSEDLDIYDSAGALLESVQVKALSSKPLTISALFSDGGESFFHRALVRLGTHPRALQKVASFGPFGSTVLEAWASHGSARKRTEEFLASKGLKKNDVARLFRSVAFEVADEATLEDAVLQQLGESIASAAPKVAFVFLSGWLFSAMENKERVTAQDLHGRLKAIGAFVTIEALKHHEWYSNIVPLGDRTVPDDRGQLSDEFYRGTHTRYEHVLADLDVVRSGKLDRIARAFRQRNVVVVHGASGQGKTSLAYRYVHDCTVGTWAFEVRLLEDGAHALRVARILSEHARAIGVRLLVYVDVAPRNLHWRWLVRELGGTDTVRVLVTVREEDWARAKIEGLQLEVADVEIDFDETEARELYSSLAQKQAPAHLLSFDEAWLRFRGGGPLMEFAYLVTQSEALHVRLAEQIKRLRDEVRRSSPESLAATPTRNDLELLRRVAVASGYGARLAFDRLAADLDLPDVDATLDLFEREYLLRRSDDSRLLEGLHPIRSDILANLLTANGGPTSWAKTACACLRAMAEEDIQGFLLHAFSRRPGDTAELVAAFDAYHSETWTGLAGEFRALLWLGVRTYADLCTPLVDEAEKTLGTRLAVIIPFDPADVSARWPEMFPQWDEMDWIREDVKTFLRDVRLRMPPKDVVAARARAWLLTRMCVSAPMTQADWTGAAEVVFWAAYWNIWTSVAHLLPTNIVQDGLSGQPMNVAGDVCLALSFALKDQGADAFSTLREALLKRYRQELMVPVIEDDGTTAVAHFIVVADFLQDTRPLNEDREAPLSKNVLHAETIRRVELLRSFLLGRATYGTQGHGHNLAVLPLEHDETTKHIAISRLLPQWLPRVNGMLIEIMESRPDSWVEHARAVYSIRKRAVNAAGRMRDALLQYFRKSVAYDVLGGTFRSGEIDELGKILGDTPRLPRNAVGSGLVADEHEEPVGIPDDLVQTYQRYRAESKAYDSALKKYTSSLQNFYTQSPVILACNPWLGRAKGTELRANYSKAVAVIDEDGKSARLSVYNLADALQQLPLFQRLFRQQFVSYFGERELAELEAQELVSNTQLWCVWYQFAFHPSKVSTTLGADAEAAFAAPVDEARRRLKKNFKGLDSAGIRAVIHSEHVSWEDQKALWITVDVDDPLRVYEALTTVLEAVQKAVPSFDERIGKLVSYSYMYWWRTVHIIPLIRGRALERHGWRFLVASLPRSTDDFGSRAAKFILRDIPMYTWRKLNVELLSGERLEVGRRFRAAFAELSVGLEHLLSLRGIPELDELGGKIVATYGERQLKAIADAQERMFAAIDEVADYSASLDTELLAKRQMLIEIASAFQELLPKLAAPERIGESQDDMLQIEAWCEQLRDAAIRMEFVWLAWVSDVLGEEQKSRIL